MHKRQILIIAGILILGGSVLAAYFIFSGKVNKKENTASMPANKAVAVETKQVSNQSIQTYIELTGRLQPEDKIDIYSEVSGTLQIAGKPFKTGIQFNKGELMLSINGDEFNQSLISQRANFISTLANSVADLKIDYPEIYEQWYGYLMSLNPEKRLPPLPSVQNQQQKLFLTGRNIYGQYHKLKQSSERLSKYYIYAPFKGTVTEVSINEGTLVRQGQRLGEFVQTGIYELGASVGLQDRDHIQIGDTVMMQAVEMDKKLTGIVSRINEKVSQQTQTIDVYIRVRDEALTTGMYMEGKIASDSYPAAVRLPRTALVNEQEVYVMQDSTAHLQQVEVLHKTNKKVVVKGLEDQAYIILGSKTAAFEGSKVTPVKRDSL